MRLRTAGKPVGNVVSLNGPVAWIWDAEIPDGVHSVLDSLCADVAYLGESDSPVVLELAYAQPTHRVDPAATAFAIGGEWVRAPRAGRLEELDQAHDEAYPVRTPSIAKDAHAQGELTAPPPLTKSAALVRRRYASVDARPVAAPWRHAWALRLAVPIPQDSVVPMCVAVHRALVARIAEPAPSVVTGRYGEGQMRPPNRLAIHYVDPSLAPLLADPRLTGGAGAILVAFPADTETESQTAVERAVAGIRRLYHRDFAVAVTGMSGADATGLWEAPVPGMVRLWTSVTPLVAETRPQPGTWSLADAAALSVAFVARDALDLALDPALGRGEQRYRALVQAAKARGVRVGSTVPVHDSHVERYAHRLPESVVAQPYRAIATLGDLWNPQAFVALGQSRHLGGGFMAPMDVPAAVAAALTGGRQ